MQTKATMSTIAITTIEPIMLRGRHVALLPLAAEHLDGLVAATRDGELWRLWYTGAPEPDGVAAEIARRLDLQEKGRMVPFTVVEAPTGRIVGMTSYMNIERGAPRVEIGSTWYAASVQRTGLNTEAELLLLGHAFDALGHEAVEFRTHVLNSQSRRAIERLGARFEGILRANQIARDGTLRDTAVYSIVRAEWPAVRSHLTWQLERPRAAD